MSTLTLSNRFTKPLVFDLVAIVVFYFIPAIAHLVSMPLYMLEPMRLIVILGVVHTSKPNAYLLAATLPVFSLIVSGHPELVKALIITIELLANVWIYNLLAGQLHKSFLPMVAAIILSKLACYFLYWIIFSWAFVVSESSPVFLTVQVITTIIFSGYLYFFNKPRTLN